MFRLTVEVPKTAGVHRVSPSSNEPAGAWADDREDGPNHEESSTSGCGKEGHIGIGCDCRVDLTRTSETGKGIVHLTNVSILVPFGAIQGFGILTPGQQKQMTLIR